MILICKTCGSKLKGRYKIFCSEKCIPFSDGNRYRSDLYKKHKLEKKHPGFTESMDALRAAWESRE